MKDLPSQAATLSSKVKPADVESDSVADTSKITAPSAEAVLASISEGIVVVTTDWTITYVNGAAAKLTGQTEAALNGRHLWKLFPTLVGSPLQKTLEEAAQSDTARIVEYKSTRSGRCFQIQAQRTAIGLTLLFSDITALKQQHDEQRVIEERFRLAATNPSITLYEQDLDLRYLWLYPLHAEHTHALGKTDAELRGPSEDSGLVAFKREVMSTGLDQRRETRIKLPTGVRYYDVFVSPRRNERGEIIGVAGAAFDITQRKQVEEEIRLLYRFMAAVNGAAALQEIYEAALDALCLSQGTERSAILLYDEANVMRFVAQRGLSEEYRRAVEGHSPWTAEERDPKPLCIQNVVTSALSAELRATIAAEGIGAVAFVPLQLEGRLLGKFMVYFSAPHHFTSQQIEVCQTIAQQVGVAIGRQRAAQALEALVAVRTASLQEAIQQMEEFSYTVSHDLRSPLRAMISYSEALLEDYTTKLDPEITQFLQKILKSAHRMDVLVRDTLAYSRVARRDLSLTKVSLDQVIHEVLTSLDHLTLEKASVRVTSPLGYVVGHDALLVQAISNLVANAIKFVPPSVRAEVSIAAASSGDRVRLSVSDNGIGIPPQYQTRLFHIFERLNPNAGYEGTGIGLAIVRKAVERMAGKVGVISDGRLGSTFWIELPAAS